jgi:NAD-dependent DNA ligase
LGKTGTEGIRDVPLEYTCELKYDGASISITYEWNKKEPLQEEMDFRR